MIDVPQLQGGWDPSWHTTVVPFCGTTTVVFFAGGGGLLLLMQPAMRQAAINALANIFMAAPYACHPNSNRGFNGGISANAGRYPAA